MSLASRALNRGYAYEMCRYLGIVPPGVVGSTAWPYVTGRDLGSPLIPRARGPETRATNLSRYGLKSLFSLGNSENAGRGGRSPLTTLGRACTPDPLRTTGSGGQGTGSPPVVDRSASCGPNGTERVYATRRSEPRREGGVRAWCVPDAGLALERASDAGHIRADSEQRGGRAQSEQQKAGGRQCR